MTETKDTLLDWLRDAHAMEQQAEKMLGGFAKRLENYPELKARVEAHAVASTAQQRALEGCIERAGSSTSALKNLGGKVMGIGQSLSGVLVEDEVIKGVMSIYVFTHMEIASYRILSTAAEYLGDTATLTVCRQHLDQELAMASWLEDHLPAITGQFITRKASDSDAAKR